MALHANFGKENKNRWNGRKDEVHGRERRRREVGFCFSHVREKRVANEEEKKISCVLNDQNALSTLFLN